jgi:hypothetical protein
MARRLWLAATIVLGCGATDSALAEDTGFEAGLRVGYGIALGDAAGGPDDELSDGISGQIPLILDVGYRVIPSLFIGVYAQYGFGIVGDRISEPCDVTDQIDCSAQDIRLGIQGLFHVSPGEKLDPWIGLGFGYEWMTLAVEGGGLEFSSTFSGFELFNLQAGLDVAVSEHFYLGPFLSFSFAQYDTVSTDCSGAAIAPICSASIEGDIEDTALHHWLILGVRGAYAP